MENKATPRPWHIKKCPCGHPLCNQYFINVTGSDGRLSKEDAELIVRAVNEYDRLKTENKIYAERLEALHNERRELNNKQIYFDELIMIAEFVRDHSSGLIKHECEVLLTKVNQREK